MLKTLFSALHDVVDGPLDIQRRAASVISDIILNDKWPELTNDSAQPLPPSIRQVMDNQNAHPCCQLIVDIPFNWVPPTTSNDPLYLEHSVNKAHVELVGPEGVIPSSEIRLGLYGIQPHTEYGLRTHPAEEIFIMLAGEADWMRGETSEYQTLRTGEYSYHPSQMAHATRTTTSGFLSVYIWHGDLSTERYVYYGAPHQD